MSGYYAQQNAGKRNVSIDLNVPGARELALRLCDTADVVVENFRADTLRYFGLDYTTLATRNPRLIYASITGYGQGGPWQGRMAYAPTVQAEAGFTHNSLRHYGEVLGEPRTDSLSHADVYAGLQAAIPTVIRGGRAAWLFLYPAWCAFAFVLSTHIWLLNRGVTVDAP